MRELPTGQVGAVVSTPPTVTTTRSKSNAKEPSEPTPSTPTKYVPVGVTPSTVISRVDSAVPPLESVTLSRLSETSRQGSDDDVVRVTVPSKPNRLPPGIIEPPGGHG